jgi:hypothetical protein
VGHEGGGGLEVLEAHGALHACDAVVAEDVLIEITWRMEGLPIEVSICA